MGMFLIFYSQSRTVGIKMLNSEKCGLDIDSCGEKFYQNSPDLRNSSLKN